MSDSIKKSRDLTIYDYLVALQTEYVVAELRKKISTRSKDKEFYDRVLHHKKDKIEDICSRNNLHSIFTDANESKSIRNKVYKLWGIPTFTYRDPQEKLDIQKRDIYNYLCEKSEIRVLSEDNSTTLATIIYSKKYLDSLCDLDQVDDMGIEVKLKGESNTMFVLIKHISRIL